MNRQRPNLVAPRRRSPERSPRFIPQLSAFDDLGRKDLFTGLGLWVVLEIVSFVLMPAMGAIQPGERMRAWFSLSIPLGLGGAFLLSFSSRFVAITHERNISGSKALANFLGQFGGWLGFAGITFPFFMVVGEFLTKAFSKS